MKRILGIGFFILLLLGGMGYYYTQHDHRNAIRSASPDLTMTATEIFALFDDDEEEANKKLLGKIVLIEGTVTAVASTAENASITLDSGAPLGEVVCELNVNLVKDLSRIEKGNIVKVKGECSGKLMDVIFVNCIIEEK